MNFTCNNQSRGGVDIKWRIFQDYSLSTLLFALCLITFTLSLRKSESAYQLSSSKENINCLPFIDDSNLYANNEKGLDPLAQTVRDSYSYISYEEEEITKFDGISLPDERAMKRLTEGAGYKYLGIYSS